MRLIEIIKLLSGREKNKLIQLSISSIIISIIEAAGISLLVLFITIATDFRLIKEKKILNELYELSKIESELKFVIGFGILTLVFYVIRGGVVYWYQRELARYTHNKAVMIANELFATYLKLPYKFFKEKNSSTLTKTIVHESSHLISIVASIMVIISESLIVIMMLAMIVIVDVKMTTLLFLVLAALILPVVKSITQRIKKAGDNREKILGVFYEIINRSFNNFKLLKLTKSTDAVQKIFQMKSGEYCDANVTNASLSQIPRLYLETTSFAALTLMVILVLLNTSDDISKSMGLITMYVLTFYRIMPSISRVINAWNQINYYAKSVEVITNDLALHVEELSDNELEFHKSIELKNVSFSYPTGKNVLKNVNLVVNKGEKIGISGKTGSGKSTLIDIICGLHNPNTGELYADGKLIDNNNLRSWRRKIAYIPQNIYLFDGTVAENVAFDLDVNVEKVRKVLQRVGLEKYFGERNGIETEVGEGGGKLSGGQKQRVALARALYREAEIIILDEATSGLDTETEAELMEEIYSFEEKITVFIVAHRLNTLHGCDRRIHLKNGVCYEK